MRRIVKFLPLLLLLLMVAPAWGQITAGPHCSNDNGSTSASTIACAMTAVPAHSLIVCPISFGGGGVFSSVADNKNAGNYLAAVAAHHNSTLNQDTGLYYYENANAIQEDVTVTLTITSGPRQFLAIACKSFTGAALSGSLDLHPAARDYNSTALAPQLSANSTPAANNELVVAVAEMNATTETAGTNFVSPLTDSCTSTLLFNQYWIQTTATATNGAFGSTDTAWTEEVASFQAPAASTSTPANHAVIVY